MSMDGEQATDHQAQDALADERISPKTAPVILITGTPGTGKTTHAQLVAEQSPVPLRHLNIGDLIKEKGLHSGFDEEWQSYIVDEDNEDKLLDELESIASAGGIILDWHTCEMFPERWIDLVVVLRCDHTQLWDRLEQRGYPMKKIQENNETEIMQVVLEEARESYAEEIVVELKSESTEDLEGNVARIVEWIRSWQDNNAEPTDHSIQGEADSDMVHDDIA